MSISSFFHRGAEADNAEPFDPIAALAAEGLPAPQPIELPPASEIVADANGSIFGITYDNGVTISKLRMDSIKVGDVVNPKEAAGSKKPGVWSVFPRWVSLLVGRVMETGASKYGKFNYRDSAIAASTYEDAMERHAQLWFDGEDNDPESGVSHLAHVIACATLLLDAQATGKLVDNRQKTGVVRRTLNELEELRRTLPLPGNIKV